MINLVKVDGNSSRNDRRDFVAMLNKFRSNYFRYDPPEDYGMGLFRVAEEENVTLLLIQKNNVNIGIVEMTNGEVGTVPVRCIGTIYILPKYRKNNISKLVYNLIEQTTNVPFCLHIEKSAFEKYKHKFWNLGFTCYGAIGDWCGSLKYNETTYMVFRKPILKTLLPIKFDNQFT